ncbi:hypothetical protein MMPV_008242 [Pyropia vietnamensis]
MIVLAPMAVVAMRMHSDADFRAQVERTVPGATASLAHLTGASYAPVAATPSAADAAAERVVAAAEGKGGSTMPDTYEPLPALLGRIGGAAGGQASTTDGSGRESAPSGGSPSGEGASGSGGPRSSAAAAAALSAMASTTTASAAGVADTDPPPHGRDESASGSEAVDPSGVVGGAPSDTADAPTTVATTDTAHVAAGSETTSSSAADGDGGRGGRFSWILNRLSGGGSLAPPPTNDGKASPEGNDGLIPPRPLTAWTPVTPASALPTTRHALEEGSVALPGTAPPDAQASRAGGDNGGVAAMARADPHSSAVSPDSTVSSDKIRVADVRASEGIAASARVHPWAAPTDRPLCSTDDASKGPVPSSSRKVSTGDRSHSTTQSSTVTRQSVRIVGEELPRSLPTRTQSIGVPLGSVMGSKADSDLLPRHALEVGTVALPRPPSPRHHDSVPANSGTLSTATGTHALPTDSPVANDKHPFPAPFGSRPTSIDDAGDGPVFPTISPPAPVPSREVRALDGLAGSARVHPWPAPFGTRPTSSDDAGDGPVFPTTPAPDGTSLASDDNAAAAARAAATAMSDSRLVGTPQRAAAGSRPTSIDDAGDGPVVPGYFPDRSSSPGSHTVRAAAGHSARAGSRPTSEDDAGDGPVVPLYYPDAAAAAAGDWSGHRGGRSTATVVKPDSLGSLIPPRWSAVPTATLPSLAWTADPAAHGLDVGTIALPHPADAVLPGTHSDMEALADWWAALDVPPVFSRDTDTSAAGVGPVVPADPLGGLIPRRWDAAPATALPSFVRDTNADHHVLEVGSVALPRPEDAVRPPPPPPPPVRAGAGSRIQSADDIGDGPVVPVYRDSPQLPEAPRVSAGAGTRRVGDAVTEGGDGPVRATAGAAAPDATAAGATEPGAADQPLAASLLTTALAEQVAARANAEAEAAALAAHMDEVVAAAVAARVEELRAAAAAAADGVVKNAMDAADKATAAAVRGIADGAAAAVAASRQAAAASVASATAAADEAIAAADAAATRAADEASTALATVHADAAAAAAAEAAARDDAVAAGSAAAAATGRADIARQLLRRRTAEATSRLEALADAAAAVRWVETVLDGSARVAASREAAADALVASSALDAAAATGGPVPAVGTAAAAAAATVATPTGDPVDATGGLLTAVRECLPAAGVALSTTDNLRRRFDASVAPAATAAALVSAASSPRPATLDAASATTANDGSADAVTDAPLTAATAAAAAAPVAAPPGIWAHLVAAAAARLKPSGGAVGGGTPAEAALRSAAAALAADDLPAAVAAVRRLDGLPATLVADWLADAEAVVAVRQAAAVLRAEATVQQHAGA